MYRPKFSASAITHEEDLIGFSAAKFRHWALKTLGLNGSHTLQIKQNSKADWSDINSFSDNLKTNRATKGYFVCFGFTDEAVREIRKLNKRKEIEIIPITVKKLLRQKELKV